MNNYEGSYLGSIDLETATIHSDNAVYAQLTQLVGPQNVARDGARRRDPQQAEQPTSRSASARRRPTRSRWRARSRRSPTAAPDRRLDPRQPPARRDEDRQARRTSRAQRVLSPDKTALLNSILQKVVTQGTGRARRSRTGPPPARPGRPRTTATRGSSATRRSWPWPSGSATRRAAADADRVPRRPGRGRHLPGGDLEDVHGQALRTSKPEPMAFRRRRPLRLAARRSSSATAACRSTTATAAPRRGRLLHGEEPTEDGELQAERGRGARTWSGAGRRRPARGSSRSR